MLFLSGACVQTDIENQKEDACCVSCIFMSLWRWMIAKSKLSGEHNAPQSYTFMPDNLWLGAIMLIPFTLRIQPSARKKPAVKIVSEHSGTSLQFPQMASFPKLPSSRPPAPSDDAESIIRCVWAAPISATPVGGTDIEWPFLHGSLILTQSPCLITMGTFHRVLDLINGFFLGFHLSSLFSISLPRSLPPCSPRSPCSWADNLTSPGARPP